MGFSRDTRETIAARVATVGGLPVLFSPEGTVDERTVTTAFRRETFQPGLRQLESLPANQGQLREFGLYLVDLFYPLAANGSHRDTADDVGDTILAAFPHNLFLTVSGGRRIVIRESRRGPGLRDPAHWWHVPIEIRWETTTINPLA